MNALRVLCACVPLCLCASLLPAQGVVLRADIEPRVERVGVVSAAGVDAYMVNSEIVAVPSDDAGKWQILLFTGPNCPACERLTADLAGNANLKALAEWADLWIFDWGQESQRWRFASYQVEQTPTLVVTPPPTSKTLPYCQVFRRSGYAGNPNDLAGAIVKAIRAFEQKVSGRPNYPNPSPQPGPCPCPTPSPSPGPSPGPSPSPSPISPLRPLLPALPNFPPETGFDLLLLKKATAFVREWWPWLLGGLVLFWMGRQKPQAQTPATAPMSAAATPAVKAAAEDPVLAKLRALERRVAQFEAPPSQAAAPNAKPTQPTA